MTERVEILREQLLEKMPYLSSERLELATEAYEKYAGEPIPIFRARVLEYVLAHKEIVIYPGELIVGTLTEKVRAAGIFPEYLSGDIWLVDELKSFPTRKCDPFDISEEDIEKVKKNLTKWRGKSIQDIMESYMPEQYLDMEDVGMFKSGGRECVSGHIHPNYRRLLSDGFLKTIEELSALIEATKKSGLTVEKQRKIDYWDATIIVLNAAIMYAERYADKAHELALVEKDEKRKQELLLIEKNCRNVPAKPASGFYEALQFQWFIHVLIEIEGNSPATSLGRFDVNLYPYLKKDKEEGNITDEQVVELLELLFIKVTTIVSLRSNYYSQALAGYPMWQILMIGGQDKHGNDVTNDLSYLVLDAAREVKLAQPAVALRIHENTPEDLFQKACVMIQEGLANPAFFGDKAAMEMVQNKGGTLEEAREWIIVGCVEPHQGGGGTVDGSPVGGYVNAPKALELALHNGVDPITGKKIGLETGDPASFTSIEQVIEATKKQLAYEWENLAYAYNCTSSVQGTRYPAIFASVLLDGCIEKAKSIQEGGPKYCYTNTFIAGPATTGDSIAAIEWAVFRDKVLSMEELINLCDHNFEGEERIRQYLINKPPKFGNDDKYVDSIVSDLVAYGCDHVQKIEDARGGKFSAGNLSQTYNVTLGECVGATPDGRKAFTALSDNASPAMGKDISGPTASANSISKMKQGVCHGGVLYNLRFDPRGVEGENGIKIIEGVVKNFCANGGQHIQINVVDDATLRKAQEKPEDYRNLVVRVAGYMAYFTELDKGVQDIIIERTAHLA